MTNSAPQPMQPPAPEVRHATTALSRTWVQSTLALLSLGRPRLLPWLLGILLFGYAFALWDGTLEGPALQSWGLTEIPGLFFSWTLLHFGTLWLNTALDGGEEPVILARRHHPPVLTAPAAYLALALCVASASGTWGVAGGVGFWCTAACAVLAVAYSHPRLAWKGHSVLGPLVNALGYGVLAPLAGWSVTGAPVTWRGVVTFSLWTVWILGAYFAAQAFQETEDRARGYRTLVATHGARFTLATAQILMEGALVVAVLLTLFGVYPRVTLLAYPWFLVPHWHMKRWRREPHGGTPQWAVGLFHRMLIGGLLIIALAGMDVLFSLE